MSEPLIQQAYRFALDPTVEQEAQLGSFTGASRFWFNAGLALVKERLAARERGEDVSVPWSYKSLCSEFKGDAVKDELAPWRAEVVTGSYQAGLEALGRALQNFSEGRRASRQVGFPRFRAKGRCRESVIFQRPRIKSARHVEFDRRLGPIRTKERMSKLSRLLDRNQQARIVRATVSRSCSKWYVSFTVERSAKQRRARRPDAAVGIDVGDLNAALNLARMAQQHAQAEGMSNCHVARTERETRNARRGQVSPTSHGRPSPMKREASSEAAQVREDLALAA